MPQEAESINTSHSSIDNPTPFQEHLDRNRSLNVVDYIVKVMMQLPLDRDGEGRKKKSPFGWRFMGDYLFGWSFTQSKNSAEGAGEKFFLGESSDSTNKLVSVIGRLRQNMINKYAVQTGQRKARGLGDVPEPTGAQILEAFQILHRLAPEEIRLLKLPVYCQHPLLQQAYINLATMPVAKGQNLPEAYREVYERSLVNRDQTSSNMSGLIDNYVVPFFQEQPKAVRERAKEVLTELLRQAETGELRFESLDEITHHVNERLQDESEEAKKKVQDALTDWLLKADTAEVKFETLKQIDSYVKKYLKGEPEATHIKVQNALKRLLLQAGTGQARFLKLDDQKRYIQNYLSVNFIEQLSDTVCENNRLTARFPIYLKKTSQELVGAFPMPKPNDNPREGWLSATLLSLQATGHLEAPIDQLFTELPTRTVMRVTGHFYIRQQKSAIKEESKYQGFDYETHCKMRNVIDQDVRIPFTLCTTGIGGTYSLITQLLNRALLSDINGLRKEYFPIAHDLLVEQDNVNQRVLSPVSSHSFVQLCRTKTVAKAMEASITRDEIPSYEEFSGHDPRGAANYCEFDMLHAAANAPWMARLQAISNTGLDPQTYIFSLLSRVEQQYILNEAKALLKGYPFSSFAMASWLRTKLLDADGEAIYADSYVMYEARLILVETFLTEGAYRKAHQHLAVVHEAFYKLAQGVNLVRRYRAQQEAESPDAPNETAEEVADFTVISGQLLARYEICMARYFGLFDVEREPYTAAQHRSNPRNKTNPPDYYLGYFPDKKPTRTDLIQKSWEHLTRAQQHLTVRLMKYHIVDEISQATLHPYYQLLAQIYLHRAKLFVWYPTLLAPEGDQYKLPTQSSKLHTRGRDHANQGRLFLFERARVYAACDGDDGLYIISTAYQCRAWLMAAFTLQTEVLTFPNSSPTPLGRRKKKKLLPSGHFDKQRCLEWARKLRNHAILQYAPIGQDCYHAIKEKSGLEGDLANQRYRDCKVQSIPPIRETTGVDEPFYDLEKKVLYLDMDYLAVRKRMVDDDNPDNSQGIYLFGPRACHLFFIRGLYHLSSNDSIEFPRRSANNAETNLSLQAWEIKLKRCYHLFNYAWSIAGNGCGIDSIDELGMRRKITREMEHAEKCGIENGIIDKHAISVWNLYPHRITEIVEVGKVYSAACAALRCYTTRDSALRTARCNEMEKLLESFPCYAEYKIDSDLKKAIDRQERLNGHLGHYLERCSQVIREVARKAQSEVMDVDVLGERDQLLTAIFSLDAL